MSFPKTFVLLLSYHLEPGLIKVFFFLCFFFFYKVNLSVKKFSWQRLRQWKFLHMIIIYNDKPAFLSLFCLLLFCSYAYWWDIHFSTQALKKCIFFVSSILYSIPAPPFLILHVYYDYRESSVEANSPHVPPKTLVLWLIAWLHFLSEIFPFFSNYVPTSVNGTIELLFCRTV